MAGIVRGVRSGDSEVQGEGEGEGEGGEQGMIRVKTTDGRLMILNQEHIVRISQSLDRSDACELMLDVMYSDGTPLWLEVYGTIGFWLEMFDLDKEGA
jgi:hypothetical protein